jgi:hypothetical protein
MANRILVATSLCVSVVAVSPPARAADSGYPTAARADYVIACMAANGNTREALLKCSCAIDTIAEIMPYAHYEQAETALGLQAGGGVGGRVGLFRDPPQIACFETRSSRRHLRRLLKRPSRREPAGYCRECARGDKVRLTVASGSRGPPAEIGHDRYPSRMMLKQAGRTVC